MADVHDRIREWWDRDAGTYDRSASHAMTDPVEAAAWRAALQRLLPVPPARVLDVGAGTGALSLLAAELGHRVTAVDLSPGMLDRARAKAEAQGLDIEFVVGPAEAPPAGPFDAVIERHVLWTAPDPVRSLRAWHEVAPAGQVVLFEGAWGASGLVGRGRDAAGPPRAVRPPDPVLAAARPVGLAETGHRGRGRGGVACRPPVPAARRGVGTSGRLTAGPGMAGARTPLRDRRRRLNRR